MKAGKQTTLRSRAAVSGIGVHSGLPVTLTLYPADAGTGVVFIRRVDGRRQREIRANARSVTATELATVLGDASGPGVSTIEHIMAALCGLGVDNVIVELDGPEAPIMDGSAAPFVQAIDEAGIVSLPAARRYTKVLKPIRVAKGDAYGELRPYDRGFRVEVEIEFDHPLIGRQALAIEVGPATFRREIARARTFGFLRDVGKLWGAGYALGASLENTLVVSEDRVLNPEGLRFCGRAHPGRLPVRARRPQAQSRGAHRADRRSLRLDHRGRAQAAPARTRRAAGRDRGAGLGAGPVLSRAQARHIPGRMSA